MRERWREITQRVSKKDQGYRYGRLLTHMENWHRNNPGKDVWAAFFNAAGADKDNRLYIWDQLDKALVGNGHDPGAEHLKSALYHLPIEQHYRVAYLFAEKEIMVRKYGTGGMWRKGFKGAKSSAEFPVYCEHYYERFEKQRVGYGNYFAGCYSFEHEGRLIEIVPDAYEDTFSTAALWWMTEDKELYSALERLNKSRRPRAWCDLGVIQKARELKEKSVQDRSMVEPLDVP